MGGPFCCTSTYILRPIKFISQKLNSPPAPEMYKYNKKGPPFKWVLFGLREILEKILLFIDYF